MELRHLYAITVQNIFLPQDGYDAKQNFCWFNSLGFIKKLLTFYNDVDTK